MFARKLGWLFLFIVLQLAVTKGTGWAQCSQQTVKGTWVTFEEGTVLVPFPIPVPPPYLFTSVGRATFDGAGHFSGTYVASLAGMPEPTATVEGMYDVSADCAYSDDFYTSTGQHLHHTGYIVSGEGFKEVHFIYSDPGWMISGTGKK